MASEYVDSGVPFLRSQNIEPFAVNRNDLKFISAEFHARIKKSVIRAGDVAIVRTGKPGTCAVIPSWLGEANCSDLVLVRCGKAIRPKFLCYWINSVASHHISSHTVGAVQQHFNVGAAKTMDVAVPSLRDQDEVLSVLASLDDRIELLNATHTTLEAIVQALFKSWLVDFDPVRAKMEGLYPAGMDDATAAQFPDSLYDSALGNVPTGWTLVALGDILEARNERVGQHVIPEYASTNDGLVPRAHLYKKQLASSPAKNKVVRRGDIVFGLSRAVLNFGLMDSPVGSVSSAYKVYSVRRDVVHPEILYRLMRIRPQYFFNAVSASSREGQSVSESSLRALKFVQPPSCIQDAWCQTVEPLLTKAHLALKQADTLSKIRNALLPRMISGQLRLDEAAEALEAT
jgi:type I restriction enzyme, S subunit